MSFVMSKSLWENGEGEGELHFKLQKQHMESLARVSKASESQRVTACFHSDVVPGFYLQFRCNSQSVFSLTLTMRD